MALRYELTNSAGGKVSLVGKDIRVATALASGSFTYGVTAYDDDGWYKEFTGTVTVNQSLNPNRYLPTVATAPMAVVGLVNLVSGYTGKAVRVVRISDNAELDIGFVNDVLDMTTALNFQGSSELLVKTWYDQTGKGNHLTSTNRPILWLGEGGPVIVSFSSAKPFVIPASVTFDRADCSIFIATRTPGQGAVSAYWMFGDANNLDYGLTTPRTIGQNAIQPLVNGASVSAVTANLNNKANAMANMNLIGIVSSASKQVCHRGEQTVEYPPAASKALTLGGQLGAGFNFSARLDMRAWVVYPAALSDSDTTAVKASLKISCGTMDPLTKFIYITGDSIIYGTGGTHNRTISAALSEIAGKTVGIRNTGIAGHQLSGHYQDFKNSSLRHNYPGVPNIFISDFGHNDIKALIEAGSTPQQAVDTMVSQIKALCADLRTLANFNKIVWQECLSDARVSPDWTPAMESARDIWNATLRAGLLDTNGVNCFDAIDRVASDSTFILSDAETDAGRGMLLAANTDRLHPAEIYASARAAHLFATLSTLN